MPFPFLPTAHQPKAADQPDSLKLKFQGKILEQIQRAARTQGTSPQEFVRTAVVAALDATDTKPGDATI